MEVERLGEPAKNLLYVVSLTKSVSDVITRMEDPSASIYATPMQQDLMPLKYLRKVSPEVYSSVVKAGGVLTRLNTKR